MIINYITSFIVSVDKLFSYLYFEIICHYERQEIDPEVNETSCTKKRRDFGRKDQNERKT